MKILTMLILTLFMGKGCEEETQIATQNTILEYTRNTRGFYEKITIRNQEATISKDRSGEDKSTPVKISDADWRALTEAFTAVNLDEVANMKAPTEKRFYDGAAMADLKITYNDKVYQSQTFDHGHPPAGIEKLVNKITAFSTK
ncbi:MAG TPA: hypothetical protein VGB50_07760 [Flavobacterium sp.]|jgi:restriction endonuclease Mrr